MTEPMHTNRLIHETSPYLLQHAHNPVDWRPWGDEALTKARAENKPILLSVGYSACHWCHVMEHESFENEDIARLMNEHYVPIKVDREERPDIDQIYQTACQLTTGQGGWPLTVFLTPQLEPFFVGTYFPPGDRYGRPGFRRVLESIAHFYHAEPEKVRESTEELGRALRVLNQPGRGAGELDEALLDRAAASMAGAFDHRNGGFGRQPKFPNTMSLELFLRKWKRSGESEYRAMVELTLRQMASGGIYDQLGGGFHRYSVDERWLVPHFEKMLYDNALLARLYFQMLQCTGDEYFGRIGGQILTYVQREMTDAAGGFYSTQDADSEGEEGRFFVWTPAQIEEILGRENSAAFCELYDVSVGGNFEHGKSILHLGPSAEQIANRRGVPIEELVKEQAGARKLLFEARERRVKPGLDDKVLTGWNGLMISAFAAGARVLGDASLQQCGERAARFLKSEMFADGRLKRSWRHGRARGDGYLEDYAFLAAGLLDLYEGQWDAQWLDWASQLTETMIELFHDSGSGDFLLTPAGASDLIVRPRQSHDQSIPSGVSVAVNVLTRLSSLLNRADYRDLASGALRANAEEMSENAHGAGNLICSADFYLNGPAELILRAARGALRAQLSALYRTYQPALIVVTAEPEAAAPPVVEGKRHLGGELTAYICRNFTCSPPMQSWDDVMSRLEQRD